MVRAAIAATRVAAAGLSPTGVAPTGVSPTGVTAVGVTAVGVAQAGLAAADPVQGTADLHQFEVANAADGANRCHLRRPVRVVDSLGSDRTPTVQDFDDVPCERPLSGGQKLPDIRNYPGRDGCW